VPVLRVVGLQFAKFETPNIFSGDFRLLVIEWLRFSIEQSLIPQETQFLQTTLPAFFQCSRLVFMALSANPTRKRRILLKTAKFERIQASDRHQRERESYGTLELRKNH
jgi:hypothetical protein